jgi:hypothetical protein
MATEKTNHTKDSANFEREVYDALKHHGFDLIKTDEELETFIENFGETKIELPEGLSNANELFNRLTFPSKELHLEKYAFAAKGQKGPELPPDIIEKMKSDIALEKQEKIKNKRNGRRKKKTD